MLGSVRMHEVSLTCWTDLKECEDLDQGHNTSSQWQSEKLEEHFLTFTSKIPVVKLHLLQIGEELVHFYVRLNDELLSLESGLCFPSPNGSQ